MNSKNLFSREEVILLNCVKEISFEGECGDWNFISSGLTNVEKIKLKLTKKPFRQNRVEFSEEIKDL